MSPIIRPQTQTDYAAIASLEQAILNFPITVESVAAQAAENPQFVAVVAEQDGQIIGRAAAGFMHNHTPAGDLRCMVNVAADHRRQGVGGALWSALLEAVQQHKPAHLRANGNPKAMEFVHWAERRGFVQTHTHLFQGLDLTRFNAAPYTARLEQLKAEGYRFVPFSDLRTPESEVRLWQLYNGYNADTPDGDSEPPEEFEPWKGWVLEGERSWVEGILVIVAPDGDWAGFTLMQKEQEAGSAHTFMTGLSREYRGKGLAIPLKVAAALYAREQGIPKLTTLNHSANERIVAVNRSLGYEVIEGVIRLVRKCEW